MNIFRHPHYLIIIGLLLSSGCAQLGQNPFLRPARKSPEKNLPVQNQDVTKYQPPRGAADQKLFFTLDSDPPGASVYQRVGFSTNYLGNTPMKFSLELRRRNPLDVLNLSRKPKWSAFSYPGRELVFSQTAEVINIGFKDLELNLEGYNSQPVNFIWTFPSDLKERVGTTWPKQIAQSHQHTVVMQTPSRPQAVINVKIESRPSGGRLHVLDQSGNPGELVGNLPLSFSIGAAPKRSADGKVTSWLMWSRRDDANLWKINEAGELDLYATLLVDGFNPERIVGRTVASVSQSKNGQNYDVILEPGTPSLPSKELVFTIDSLPSDATIYELRDDGTLGAKISQTPYNLNLGLAQELQYLDPDGYVHKDWRIWSSNNLLKWENKEGGVTDFRLSFALYKEGYAVENISKPVFTLSPGSPFPDGTTLTFPLVTPDQAAARESRDLQRDLIRFQGAASTPRSYANDPAWVSRTASGSENRETSGYVWEATLENQSSTNTVPEEKPWWRRIMPRK